jgi:hypothetical protein
VSTVRQTFVFIVAAIVIIGTAAMLTDMLGA